MKQQITQACLAISAFLFTGNYATAQNTFPTGAGTNVGIGTTSPTADLEINSNSESAPDISLLIKTGFIDANGFNQESVKIINRERDNADISTNDIFSIWREWIPGGGGSPYMESDPYFSINYIGNASVNANLFVKDDLRVQHDINVNNNIHADNNIDATHDGGFGNDLGVGHNASIANDLTVGNILNATNIAPATGTDINLNGVVKTSYADIAGNLTVGYDISTGDNLYVGQYATIGLSCGAGAFGASGTVVAGVSMTSPAYYISSDRRLKKNIEPLKTIKDQLFKVEPFQYNFNKDISKKWNFNDLKHYGFLAQDIQKVFPELVGESDSEGFLSVNYTEFIPMLLSVAKEQDQTINAQQLEINELKSQLADLSDKVNTLLQQTGINTNTNDGNTTSLEQNVPNPFNSETRIRYNIAGKFTNAYIGVYDLSGKEVKKLQLNSTKGEAVIPANGLQAGLYIYSLLVDGQLINTKKMAIIE